MRRPLPSRPARRSPRAARHAVRVAAALALAACGGAAKPAADSTAAEPSAASGAAAAAAQAPTDLCAVLPPADVARILTASAGVAVATAERSAGGGCAYRSAADDTAAVRLLVDVTRHPSPTDAAAALGAARAREGERGIAVADAPELGDGAFVVRDGLTASAKLAAGAYAGQVNLSAGEAPASDRTAAAARAVAAEVRRRLDPAAGGR